MIMVRERSKLTELAAAFLGGNPSKVSSCGALIVFAADLGAAFVVSVQNFGLTSLLSTKLMCPPVLNNYIFSSIRAVKRGQKGDRSCS